MSYDYDSAPTDPHHGGKRTIDMQRSAEVEKYRIAYDRPGYRMGHRRLVESRHFLSQLPHRGAYLDVGCGRREMMKAAEGLGFVEVRGLEVVDDLVDMESVFYGCAHANPFGDNAFDIVTMFDVIEHLLPGDDEAACRELARVASRDVILTREQSKHRRRPPESSCT